MSQAESLDAAASQADDDADLKVVPVRRRIGVATAFGLMFLVVVLLSMVAFQAFIVRNQSSLDDLDSRIEQAQRDNELLRFQVSELESPDRIRTVAIEKLGMMQPEEVVYLPPISEGELAPEPQLQPVDSEGVADQDNDDTLAADSDTVDLGGDDAEGTR